MKSEEEIKKKIGELKALKERSRGWPSGDDEYAENFRRVLDAEINQLLWVLETETT